VKLKSGRLGVNMIEKLGGGGGGSGGGQEAGDRWGLSLECRAEQTGGGGKWKLSS